MTRTILAAFPDHGASQGWYDSDAYQTLVQHRFASSQGDIALLQGLDMHGEAQ